MTPEKTPPPAEIPTSSGLAGGDALKDVTETHPKWVLDIMRSCFGDALSIIRQALFVLPAPAEVQDAMARGDLLTVKVWMDRQRPKTSDQPENISVLPQGD